MPIIEHCSLARAAGHPLTESGINIRHARVAPGKRGATPVIADSVRRRRGPRSRSAYRRPMRKAARVVFVLLFTGGGAELGRVTFLRQLSGTSGSFQRSTIQAGADACV